MNELLRALRPVRNRLRLGRLLRGAAAGFALGAAAAFVLLVVTLFVPQADRWIIAALLLAGCTVLTAVVNALRPVRNAEAARTADGCGLKERAVTALELAEKGSVSAEFREAQRQDACEHLRALDPKKIRIAVPRRYLVCGAALLLLCAVTALVSGRGDRIVGARRELAEKIAPMAAKIDEAAAKEEDGRSDQEKEELRKLTDELKRELQDSRDEVDALVALDKAESRLEEMRKKTAGDAMQELADAMRNAGMESAADALESGDGQSLADALAQLENGSLQQAAEGTSADARELAEMLAQAAAEGQLTDAQLQAAAAMAQGGAMQGSPLQQALSGMKASLGGQPSENGSGAAMAAAGNQGQGVGSGAGTGTTNEEQKGGGNGGQPGSKGNRPPEYKEGAFESIYDPEKAEASFRDVATEQNKLGDDSVQIETGPGKGRLEGNVPFREVVGEYAEAEAEAAESAHLTREQKEWVDEYFRKLTEE